jgi:hypothetical protein
LPETILLAGLFARMARAGTENRPRCRTFPDLAEGEGFEAGRILHGKEGVRVAWRVADLLGGAEQSRKPGDLGARGGQRAVECSDKQLNVFGREYKRRAYLEDVAARARAVDEDARVAHPVHDIFRKLGAL